MRYLRAITALILSFAIFSTQISAAGKYINLKLTYDGSTHNYSAEEVSLSVDGKTLTDLPMPPIIFNSYTLVPAREVFEALGAEVTWLSDLYQVYIKYDEQVVMLEIDSKKAYVNGKTLDMTIAPKIINNKTMIPLRFASESIGMEVGWDPDTRVASVSKPTPATTTAATTEATTEATTKAANIFKSGSSANMSGYISAEYDTATINSLTMSSDSDSMYLVNADSAISTVTVSKLSGNIVAVDINNAQNSLPYDSYNVSDDNVISIEISQQSGIKPATRLLFNMKSENNFRLYLSSDRKTLGISIDTNEITSITMDKLIGGDRLTITGTNKPSLKTTTSTTGDLLTIDVMDAVLSDGNGSFGEGKVVSGGSYHQYNTNTVRISIDLKEKAGFTTDITGNSVSLTIATGIDMSNTSSGGSVRYDENLGLVLPGAAGIISPSNLVHSDNYNDLNYILTMNGNFSSIIADDKITVNDGRIKDIEITVSSSQTTVKFNESRIMAMNVTSTGSDLYIKPVLPKEKYDKIIVLDAGHGGTDVGTGYNDTIYEKDLTLSILNKTKALFDASNIKCYATRTTDVYPSFDDRTNLADEGDAFVSIHINSAGTNTTASGTETFCQYPNNLGNGLTSYILAERVLNKLLDRLGTVDRKVKSNDLRVLRESHVPATLAEIGFITNASDRAMMVSDEGQNNAAQAIYEAVVELFDEYPPVR